MMFWEKGALIVFVTNLIIQNNLLEEHCIYNLKVEEEYPIKNQLSKFFKKFLKVIFWK